ncbi:hypothetical protein F5X98DRAFT_369147 [Xylaria grammica]|nr:hypothetical protein F5X98DRAFT_369147 [Xylaria grammica]
MALNMDFRTIELENLWTEASTQLNGFVKTIKLTIRTFSLLGADGEAYFGRRAALLLKKATEFIADVSNPNRIYLGNAEDIEHETHGVINQPLGARLRVLRPGYGGQMNNNSANHVGMWINSINQPLDHHMMFNAGQHPTIKNTTTQYGTGNQIYSTSPSQMSSTHSLDITPHGQINTG